MGKVFLSLYINPTYHAILDKTVFMWRDQLRDLSIMTPRNRATRLRSIGNFGSWILIAVKKQVVVPVSWQQSGFRIKLLYFIANLSTLNLK